MQTSRVVLLNFAALLSGALPLVTAHGGGAMSMSEAHNATTEAVAEVWEPNYFRHSEYAGWMYAHIALMILGSVFVLPPAIMLSIARSRYHIPAQILFHAVNGLGLFTGFIYNHATPDLYVNNSHHPIGWIVTAFTVVWTLLSIASTFAARQRLAPRTAQRPSIAQGMLRHHHLEQYLDSPQNDRFSSDSGNFSGESRANSSESIFQKEHVPEQPFLGQEESEDDSRDHDEGQSFLGRSRVSRFMAHSAKRFSGAKAIAALRLSQVVLEKLLLIMGFLAITTGFIVYGGIFRKREVFSGLAHYIKGAIFFWYGLLTLGRWMGAFSNFGWAWNVRPSRPLVSEWQSRVPSAEFTESFVIWLYGASNVWLEHLNNWGQGWSPQDFEHVSITLLFFGGGLFGMLIESSWARNMMNTTVEVQKSQEGEDVASGARFSGSSEAAFEPDQQWAHPATYKHPMNPMPALVIMLLGIMMSSHHQNSMVSTMMHAQWGSLFTGFALARAVTYILMYVRPPTSHFPSRPPSELVASFCLIGGGIMFMNSAHDSVSTIEANGLDAMTIFTITMGLTGCIMAWEVVCFAIKGWATRKEKRLAGDA